MTSQEDGFLCSVSFKPVDLRNCKIDETGRPVHESCYSLMLLHDNLQLKRKPPKKTRNVRWRVAG